jgi:hypothetical protein
MKYSQAKAFITETLLEQRLHSYSAVELMLMIAGHESLGFKFRHQIGGGPALGPFQIEPPTHDDIWRRSRSIHRNAKRAGYTQDSKRLATDDKYSVFMARHRIMLDPKPIPTTLQAMADWCKREWNGDGKATPEEYLRDYNLWKDGKL